MSKASWFARIILPIVLLLLPARAPAQSMFGDTPGDNPGFSLYAAETGGGLLAGTVLTVGTVVGAYVALTKPNDDLERKLLGLSLLGIAGTVVIYPLGSAAGTSIVGGIREQYGSFWAAYAGALLGLPVGFGIAAGGQAIPIDSDVLKGAFIVAGCLTPPVGATIGYNLSRRSGVGYGLLDQHLLMPSIGLRCEPADEETAVALDMRLLNVRF